MTSNWFLIDNIIQELIIKQQLAAIVPMITQNKIKILTHTENHLVLQLGNLQKAIYKQFDNTTSSNLSKLHELQKLSHPHLLSIYKIQSCKSISGLTVGLCYQYYAGVNQFISSYKYDFDEEEIVNTFQPILEAIEYLSSSGYAVSAVDMKNIVITMDERIKFIENCVLHPSIDYELNDKNKIYEDLSELIFQMLISDGKQKCLKSWKSRLQILKRRVSKQTYTFFLSVFNKSIASTMTTKAKKICKKRRLLEGKENKLTQINTDDHIV